jgi:hypothetical protein
MMKAAQRRLSAELGREVDLGEVIGILCERFLARYGDDGALARECVDARMPRIPPHRHIGAAPNVRQPPGASFSSA